MTTRLSGVLAAIALLTACASAVAPAALPPAALPPSNIVPPGFFGTFQGTYRCAQGETGVRLTFVQGTDPDVVEGTFEFYPIPSNAAVPKGSFRMRGTTNPAGMLSMEGM